MEQTCQNAKQISIDVVTPRNVPLSAFYKRSFAFYTIKEVLPLIMEDVLNAFPDNCTEQNLKDKNNATSCLNKLLNVRNNLLSAKYFEQFTSHHPQNFVYNKHLCDFERSFGPATYFCTDFLYAESYFYQAIHDACYKALKDPFLHKKTQIYEEKFTLFEEMGEYFVMNYKYANPDDVEKKFYELLMLCLWSTKISSLYGSESYKTINDIVMDISNWRVIIDKKDLIWSNLAEPIKSTIAIILDECGFSLLMSLCLAYFMLLNNIAEKVLFYAPTIPWFVTKATTEDYFYFLLEILQSNNPTLSSLVEIWTELTKNCSFVVEEYPFWTQPFPYERMAQKEPELYAKLKDCKMVFFQGDFQYRKLVRDKFWNPKTRIETAIGEFRPCPICALEVFVSGVVCGLNKEVSDALDEEDEMWPYNGQYGIVEYVPLEA